MSDPDFHNLLHPHQNTIIDFLNPATTPEAQMRGFAEEYATNLIALDAHEAMRRYENAFKTAPEPINEERFTNMLNYSPRRLAQGQRRRKLQDARTAGRRSHQYLRPHRQASTPPPPTTSAPRTANAAAALSNTSPTIRPHNKKPLC